MREKNSLNKRLFRALARIERRLARIETVLAGEAGHQRPSHGGTPLAVYDHLGDMGCTTPTGTRAEARGPSRTKP